jgi:hypothetical protein
MSPTAVRVTVARAAQIAALLLAVLCPPPVARAQDSLEAAVKATYLYKFAPFVTWPAPGADPSFAICVVGSDPFGALLDRAVAGQRVDQRPIIVHRLPVAAHDSACEIAFVGGSRSQSVADALRVLHGAPVLTVTDGPSTPGVIAFVIDQGRVRFRIDDEAAAENDLVISSKLLSLAVSVSPRKASGLK